MPMSDYRLEADDEAAGGWRGAVTSQQVPEMLICSVSLPSQRINDDASSLSVIAAPPTT